MRLMTLDTNICSYILRRHPESVLAPLSRVKPEQVYISAIVAAELRYGVHKRRSQRLAELLEQWMSGIAVRAWTDDASRQYATLRCVLEEQGTPIGHVDLQIAAHALAERAVLVTNNQQEFARVPGLSTENWVA